MKITIELPDGTKIHLEDATPDAIDAVKRLIPEHPSPVPYIPFPVPSWPQPQTYPIPGVLPWGPFVTLS